MHLNKELLQYVELPLHIYIYMCVCGKGIIKVLKTLNYQVFDLKI